MDKNRFICHTASGRRHFGLIFPMILCLAAGCRSLGGKERTAYFIKVERGDTANGLAQKYDTTVAKLLRLNGLKSTEELFVGQSLRVEPGPYGSLIPEEPIANPKSKLSGKSKEDVLRRTLPTSLRSDVAHPDEFTEEDFPNVDASPQGSTATQVQGQEKGEKKGGLLFGRPKISKPKPDKNTSMRLHWPILGRLVSAFGPRGSGYHHGIDLYAPKGAAITPAAEGLVSFAGEKAGYGQTVVLDHGRFQTVYGHLSLISVQQGDMVGITRILGEVGETGNASGPHLHFEVRSPAGRFIDPLRVLMPLQDLASAS